MFLYLLLFLSLWAEPIHTVLLEQEIIPKLNFKIESLEIKILAKEKYFAGEASVQEAFWEWSNAPLLSLSFVKSQLVVLQQEKLERESAFFKKEDIYASEELREQFFSLQQKHLHLVLRELQLKEQFLLRLLNYLSKTEYHKKTEQSLDFYSDLREDAINKEDGRLIVRISKQEERFLKLKSILILHFTIPNSTDLDGFIQEEKALGKVSEEQLEVSGSLERLQLLQAIAADPEIEILIIQLQEKDKTFILKEKEKEFQQLQETWKLEEFSEQELRSLEKQLTENNQNLDAEIPLQKIQLQINQLKLETIRQYFEEKMQLESKKIEQELLVSQEKLEEAKKQKEADQELQEKIISLREQETKIRTKEAKRREEFLQWFNKFKSSFLEQQQKNIEGLALGDMVSGKQEKIDLSYQETHELVRTLQDKILHIRKELEELRLQTIEEDSSTAKEQKLKDAYNDLRMASLARKNNLEDEQLVLVNLLLQTHKERRIISETSSFAMTEQIQDDFWREFQFEILLAPFMTYRHWKKSSDELKSFSWNIQLISRYFQFWVLIGIGILIWRNIRNRSEQLWKVFYAWIRLQKIELVSGKSLQLSTFTEELEERQNKIVSILPNIIDIIALFISIYWIKQEHFLIHLALRIVLFFKAWQLVNPLIGIWFSARELSIKLKRGGFSLVIYILGISLFSFVLTEMFYAQRAVELLGFFQFLLLWILIFHQLGVWTPVIIRQVENIQGLEFLKKMMDRNSDSWFGIRIKSFLGLIIIVIWFCNQMLFFVAEHSQFVGGLIAKNALQQEELNLEPLSLEQHRLMERNNSKIMMLQSELEEIKSSFNSWRNDRKRGLVAIVGRRGAGKTELLNSFLEMTDSFPIRRIKKERNKICFLEEFETHYQKKFKDVSEIVFYLRTIETEIICIDNLHNSMFRDVNGYQNIKDILTIMQGTAHHHFWIVSCHHHAWTFLHSPAININLHIFRKEIVIKPKSFQQLQYWLVQRAEKLGFQLEFPNFTTIKTEEAKRRYQLSFWRVIADLSKGNPSIAELFWLDSLRKGDHENTIQMALYSIPKVETLKELQDTDYFVLASILLHDGLSIEELQETLQVSFAIVQSSCRNLLGLGLIHKPDSRYFIEPRWLASIEDILLTKRMIYLDV